MPPTFRVVHPPPQASFHELALEWQRQRTKSTTRPCSPASTVALHPLRAQQETLGASPANSIIISGAPSCPARLGTVRLHPSGRIDMVLDGSIRHAAIGDMRSRSGPGTAEAAAAFEGGDVVPLRGASGRPVLLQIGSVGLMLAPPKDGFHWILVFDDLAPALTRLRAASLDQLFFPIRPEWRILGDLGRDPASSQLVIMFTAPSGHRAQLVLVDPVDPATGAFAIAFHDLTNGNETASSGRVVSGLVLKSAQPQPPPSPSSTASQPDQPQTVVSRSASGTVVVNVSRQEAPQQAWSNQVVIDFNRAMHRPSAYTRFAHSAPVDPRNRLQFRVEAGERTILGDLIP
ncbi:hypothetical protein HK105_207848 [Polyrhizophydium stewartii]|uniref:Uncharacterized protein n=1 Tax=Polyrhizophydium stewartii TaxID=2732419 RepID=A0ABR4MZD8_9FUNG